YEPPPNANGAALASFQFKVNDSHVDSNVATVTVNVTAVNDAPVLAGIEGSALSYVESLNPTPPGASQLTNTLTVADVDNASLASGTVAITGNYQNGQDVLGYTAPVGNPITSAFNPATGRRTLT